ncbi:MAG: hypothetical protein ACLTZI_09650 [[Eubacterium] siraeum]
MLAARTGLYGCDCMFSSVVYKRSTGTALSSVGADGKLRVQNFSNANVDRAANFMQTLKNEGLASFQEGVMDVDTTPIKEGTAAFQGMGEWIISGYAKLVQKDDTLDCFFVPFPRDPKNC